jgi:uncharacterized protein YceK
MRYTKIKIGTAITACIAALALAGCGSIASSTTSQTSSPAAAATSAAATPSVSYTAAQQKFIADMTVKYNLGIGSGDSNAEVVAIGADVCSEFQSESESKYRQRNRAGPDHHHPLRLRRRGHHPGRPGPLPAAAGPG